MQTFYMSMNQMSTRTYVYYAAANRVTRAIFNAQIARNWMFNAYYDDYDDKR